MCLAWPSAYCDRMIIAHDAGTRYRFALFMGVTNLQTHDLLEVNSPPTYDYYILSSHTKAYVQRGQLSMTTIAWYHPGGHDAQCNRTTLWLRLHYDVWQRIIELMRTCTKDHTKDSHIIRSIITVCGQAGVTNNKTSIIYYFIVALFNSNFNWWRSCQKASMRNKGTVWSRHRNNNGNCSCDL